MGAAPSACQCPDSQGGRGTSINPVIQIQVASLDHSLQVDEPASILSNRPEAEESQIEESRPSRPSFVRKCCTNPDVAIMRGVSLNKTLRWGGRLWQFSPADLPKPDREANWRRSKQVNYFDVFLSHTWSTKGRWKFVSLSLQTGWGYILLSWVLATVLVQVLVLNDVLPTSPSEVFTPENAFRSLWFRPWGSYLGNIIPILVFLAAPGGANQVCFLDVASINQVDEGIMERGIYGLAGFLRASKELRILWSPPYLCRLWCIFEIAAYKFANPGGTIRFAPLFLDATVAMLWVGQYVAVLVYVVLEDLFPSPSVASIILALIPLGMVLHSLRSNMRTKRELFSQLDSFDLALAECRKEDDRKFILAAITEWYGSPEVFTKYVRGPLREELLRKQSESRLPLQYTMIILTPLLSISVDGLIARLKAGVPVEEVLSYSASIVFGMAVWLAMTLRSIVFLCDRFAVGTKPGLQDYLVTFAIFSVLVLLSYGGEAFASAALVSDAWVVSIWLGTSLLSLWLSHGGYQWVTRPWPLRALRASKDPEPGSDDVIQV